MEALIETIRSAVSPDASDEAKRQGVDACRALIATLDVNAAPQLATAQQVSAENPQATPLDIGAMVGALRAVPADQLLDLAIDRLRAALPAGTGVPQATGPRFQLVPLGALAKRS